jgi:tetratricopeptide (TPR) repeat protein
VEKVSKGLGKGRERSLSGNPRLFLNRVEHNDSLYALEYGLIYDGQRPEDWRSISDDFGYLLAGVNGPIVGFGISRLMEFDGTEASLAAIWEEPHFDAPVLGLAGVPAGEIALAARAHFGDRPSTNRMLFNLALSREEPKEALIDWYSCLEAGDSMAHFGVGCCLHDLGRYREAYRHLRYYLEASPNHPWNWCWFGKAAEAIGELDEARLAYGRAIELTTQGADETDAPELLAALTDN